MTDNKFARTCCNCGAGINEGYVIDGGVAHYCDDPCLHKHITPAEFDALFDDGDGDTYWTVWEAGDDDDDDDDA